MTLPSLEEYMSLLTNLAVAADPTVLTAEGAVIGAAAAAMTGLPEITRATLAELIREHPGYIPALGYAVGLSRYGLRNVLKHHLGSSGWISLAREGPQRVENEIEQVVRDLGSALSIVRTLPQAADWDVRRARPWPWRARPGRATRPG